MELIKKWEGYRDKAYLDTGGVWTIGYGTTWVGGKPVTKGMVCTEQQASNWLQSAVSSAEKAVTKLTTVPLNENQLEALTSFVYNLGATQFSKSTLLAKLNKNNYLGASNEFERWRFDNNVEVPGLLARRKDEKALFLKPV